MPSVAASLPASRLQLRKGRRRAGPPPRRAHPEEWGMPSIARIFWLAGQLASALLLLAGPPALAAEADTEPARRLEAVVRVQAEIPAEARTASLLGTKRDGSGVVIDDAGLIVTIGYLITEAMAAEVTTAG